MEKAYWLGRKRASLKLAQDASSSRARPRSVDGSDPRCVVEFGTRLQPVVGDAAMPFAQRDAQFEAGQM